MGAQAFTRIEDCRLWPMHAFSSGPPPAQCCSWI